MASRRANNGRLCKPVQFTERQVRALIRSAGDRLKFLTDARAGGMITGSELDRRIEEWRDIIRKFEDCMREAKGP